VDNLDMPTHRTELPSARDEVAEYLDQLTDRLESHLGEQLVAAWVIGSGALGDFDRDRSDLDVQAVSSIRHSRAELRRLATALSHDALPCPVRGLEFVLYARADLEDRAGPAFQLNLNTGRGMRQHEGFDPRSEPRFWFTLDVAIARDSALPLIGAVPSTVLPVLPRLLILHALCEALDWYGANDDTQSVLAACRAWAWTADGSWLSKGGAARWAIARLPDPRPAVKALEHRGDRRAPGPSRAEAAAFCSFVRALLDAG
jgi:hypothetical protein